MSYVPAGHVSRPPSESDGILRNSAEGLASCLRGRKLERRGVPRGLEFLLSRNRLNVAISRARCLAYLVASPRLLEVNARTIAQMRLANALCRFVELADVADLSRS